MEPPGARGDMILAWHRKIIIFSILLLFYFFISFFKVHYIRNIPRFDEKNENCFYWTESAFHYRYARMIAEGKDIPATDEIVQYPEKIKTYENFTVFMEPAAGYFYRILSPFLNIPFHVFLIYFVSFFSSLSIFAVYLISREIWRNKGAALIAALFYALTPAAYGRLIIGSYLKESFTLPFIFFSLYFFLKTGDRRRRVLADTMAGVCLFIALASWHFTQFYYTFFISALFLLFLFHRESSATAKSLLILTISAFAAGVIVPALRTKGFLLSLPMAVSYAVLFYNYVGERIGARRTPGPLRVKTIQSILLLLLASLVISAAASWSSKHAGEYSHVFSLLKYKLLFLGDKPVDPGLLPYAARVMWNSNNNTVHLNDVVYYLSSTLFLALVGMAVAAKDLLVKRSAVKKELVLILAIAFFCFYLLIVRVEVFAVFFLSLFVAGFICRNPFAAFNLLGNRPGIATRLTWGIAAVLILFPVYQITHLTLYERIPPHAQRIAIVEWIRKNTAPRASFLTSFPLESTIATYAGRPIILHSKFESYKLRERVRDFIFSLYGNEENFYRFCRKYGTDYFIYETSFLFNKDEESDRYLADKLRLKKDSAAYRFHFEPERLENFILVYQNNYYRIFKIRKDGDTSPSFVPFYHPSFDKALFTNEAVPEEYFDDETAKKVNDGLLKATEFYSRGLEYWNKGEYVEARDEFKKALKSNDRFIMAHFYLGGLLYREGKYADGIAEFRRVVELDPAHAEADSYLGVGYEAMGKKEDAVRAFNKAFALSPGNPLFRDDRERAMTAWALEMNPQVSSTIKLGNEEIFINPFDARIHNRLGILYWRNREFKKAIERFKKAIELDQGLAIAYFNLGVNYEALGDKDNAKRFYQKALEIDPDLRLAREKLGK